MAARRRHRQAVPQTPPTWNRIRKRQQEGWNCTREIAKLEVQEQKQTNDEKETHNGNE